MPTLALPPVLLGALRHPKARQDEERADANDWEETGYAFVSHRGTLLEPHNVVRQVKPVRRTAGRPETVRFHDLRHSCATLLIVQGVHLSVIKEILGHPQIRTRPTCMARPPGPPARCNREAGCGAGAAANNGQ